MQLTRQIVLGKEKEPRSGGLLPIAKATVSGEMVMRLSFVFMLVLVGLGYALFSRWDEIRDQLQPDEHEVHREYGEFGTLRVERRKLHEGFFLNDKDGPCYRLLYSGTLHDMQCRTSDAEVIQCLLPTLGADHTLGPVCWLALGRLRLLVPGRFDPMTYYHRSGPLGQVYQVLCSGAHAGREVAFIGLQAGSPASYANPGQPITFYEIDPALVRVAQTWFTYLRDSQGKVQLIVGPPRAKLAEAEDKRFRLIVVNPVGGEFTPANLLTREAVQLYLRKLADDGVVALHISNRYLDQAPVLGNIAKDLDVAGLWQSDRPDLSIPGRSFSEWVILARKKEQFGPLLQDKRWQPLKGNANYPLWTDQAIDLGPVRFKK